MIPENRPTFCKSSRIDDPPLKRFEIFHASREYAHELGDPLLGSVNATTKEQAEEKARCLGLGHATGPWAVEAKA
jgi:hypothetical protein